MIASVRIPGNPHGSVAVGATFTRTDRAVGRHRRTITGMPSCQGSTALSGRQARGPFLRAATEDGAFDLDLFEDKGSYRQ